MRVSSGGLGLTSGVFDSFVELLEPIQERLEHCDHCDPEAEAFDRGCPACIHVPRWYEDNEHLSKVEALALLAKIREVVANYVPKVIVPEAYRGRREGLLTSVADLDKMDGEVTLDELTSSPR